MPMPLPENSVVEKSILNPEAVADALERVVNLMNPHTDMWQLRYLPQW